MTKTTITHYCDRCGKQIDYHDDFKTASRKIHDYEERQKQNDKKCGSYNNTNTFKSCCDCKLIGTDSCYMSCGGSKSLYKPKQKSEPRTDAVSREAVLEIICRETEWYDIRTQIEQLPSVTQKSGKWIALVARPMTNEEREYYSEQLDYCDGDAAVYDCPLPEEGQDVLITTCTGGVLIDTFFNDYDGCGFEGYDIEDVKAWMPLPEPYEPQEVRNEE